jgi:hypothetical protein
MSYKKNQSNYQEKLHKVLSLKRERAAVSNGLDIRHADRLKIFPKFRIFLPSSYIFHFLHIASLFKVSPSPEAAPWPCATVVL